VRALMSAPMHRRSQQLTFWSTLEPMFEREARTTMPVRDQVESAPAGARRHEHMTIPDEPVPVKLWLSTRTGDLLADGEAVAWTASQVRCRWWRQEGEHAWIWVWAGAVSRR